MVLEEYGYLIDGKKGLEFEAFKLDKGGDILI
jgi:hypothetical protein